MSIAKDLKWTGWLKHALILAALVLLAWWPLIGMDFWQDDRALMFKLQHPYQAAGLFGQTLWGEGPYRGTVAPIYPLWKLFGLHPAPYFAGSIIVYCIATLAVWWLAKTLFRRSDLAMVMAAFFAVSHLGADGMLRIINSYQNLFGIIGASLTLGALIQFHTTRRLSWYLGALALYLITIEAVFVRSGGLVVAFLITDIAFAPITLNKQGLQDIGKLIIRQLPFFVLFNTVYHGSGNASVNQSVSTLLHGHIYASILSLLNTFGSLLIPDRFASLLHIPAMVQVITALIVLVITGFLIIRLWKTNRMARVMLFGTLVTFAMFLPNWIYYPTTPFNSTHRYLSGSLIGFFALMSAYLGLFIPQNKKGARTLLVAASAIILLYLTLNLQYQAQLIVGRANPSKKFYQQLAHIVPRFAKGSIFYFDVAPDHTSQEQFRDFFAVGSMPDETALAIYYGVDRYDLKIANSLDEMLAVAVGQKTPLTNLYVLHWGPDGLRDDSDKFRTLLTHGAKNEYPGIKIDEKQTGHIPINTFVGNLPSKLELHYSLTVQKPGVNEGTHESLAKLQAARELVLLHNDMTLNASSQWRFQEIENAGDNDPATSWLAHRIHFHDTSREDIEITFGSAHDIANLWWINGNTLRTATHYQIATSSDGKNWQMIKEASQSAQPNDAVIQTSFASVHTAHLRLTITQTAGGDSPQIAEIYPLPSIDPSINLDQILSTLERPYENLHGQQGLEAADQLVHDVGVRIPMHSSSQRILNTIFYPGDHTLSLNLPAGSNELQDITIGPLGVPGVLTIKSIHLTVPILAELKDSGLLKQFSEN